MLTIFDSSIKDLIGKRENFQNNVDYEYWQEQRNEVQNEIKQKKANHVKEILII